MLAKFVVLIRCLKWGGIGTGVVVCVGLVASPFWLYQQFDQETPIARLTAFPTAESNYQLNITFLDSCNTQVFDINTRQVQVDASFLKWASWLTALGVSPIYQLERLSAREGSNVDAIFGERIYGDKISAENAIKPTRYDLRPELVLPIFSSNVLDGRGSFGIDTQYGSSVYFDIDTALVYTILATEDGLVLKSTQKKPLVDEQGALVIDIDQSCSNETSLWRQSLIWLNRSLLWLF